MLNLSMVRAVRKDLEEWDRNGMWPFSCYAAQPGHKCLPGLDDMSPEEARLEAYKIRDAAKGKQQQVDF